MESILNKIRIKDIAQMLTSNSERIPMNPDATKLFTDQYSYEFGIDKIEIKADNNGEIKEDEWKSGISKLEAQGAFENSWYYIDKFYTNNKTKLSVKSLYWLKHRYDMEYEVLGKPCFAYGIDDALSDGEVKWIHVEFYNEHCFPEDYGVSDTMNYGTLIELKELIESHDWQAQGDPYGGCFFGFQNIFFYKERPWEETEKILNYMYSLGHNPEELIECVVSRLEYDCDTPEEMTFWERCSDWALRICEFPNKIHSGLTCYDEFLDTRLSLKPEDIQKRINKLGKKFLSHGARTGKQQSEYNIQIINELFAPYDYCIIDKW